MGKKDKVVFTKDERYIEMYDDNLRLMVEKGEEVHMCNVAQSFIDLGVQQGKNEGLELGRSEGLEQGRSEGLEALINTMNDFCGDFEELYKKVIANECYKDVTKEQVMKYMPKGPLPTATAP